MLNKSELNMIDTFNTLESSFAYLGEDSVSDSSANSNPIPENIKENGRRKGVIGKIAGIGANSNEPTRNGRRYPIELWRNVEKSEYFIEGMENRCIVGECNHPEERIDYSISEGAIVLTKYDIQNDGTVYTEFDILDTLPGRTLKTYFDAGCKVGVSSRGLGEEVVVNNETIIDPETYQFYCFDAVLFPAVKSARMELVESTSPKKQTMINSITKEIKNCKTLDECLFIENTAKETNLYLDEIKDCLDNRKDELSKSTEDFDPLKSDDKFKYMLLSRCQQDCDYFLNHTGYEGSLWGKSVEKHIETMRDLWDNFSEKPDWISKEDIDKYEQDMLVLKNNKYVTEGTKYAYVAKSWECMQDELAKDGFKMDSIYIDHPEEKIILYKDDKTYLANVNKYYDGSFEILTSSIKENNKIKISGEDINSDEDTTDDLDRNPDNNLELLVELQNKISTYDSKIDNLNKQLEQKCLVIRNLLSKIHHKENVISENSLNNSQLSNSLDELNKKVNSLESQLFKKETEYTKLEGMYKNLQKVNSDFSNIVEGLQIECKVNKNINKKYSNKITQIESENKKLKESIDTLSKKDSDSINELTGNVSNLKDTNTKLLEENISIKSKVSESAKLIEQLTSEKESYKSKYINSIDKYIEQVCKRFNLKEKALRRLLGDSYSISDIESTANEMYENMTKLNTLPFRTMKPEQQLYVENIGLRDEGLESKQSNELLETFDFLSNVKK